MSIEVVREIARLVVAYPDEVFVGGGCETALIAAAERALGVTFPPSYRDFLARYGFLGIPPYEVYGLTRVDRERGVGSSGVPSTVRFTLESRARGGLPLAYVAVLDHDGVEYACIDTAQAAPNGECPVVIWSVPTRAVTARAGASFDEYLLDCLADYEATATEV